MFCSERAVGPERSGRMRGLLSGEGCDSVKSVVGVFGLLTGFSQVSVNFSHFSQQIHSFRAK